MNRDAQLAMERLRAEGSGTLRVSGGSSTPPIEEAGGPEAAAPAPALAPEPAGAGAGSGAPAAPAPAPAPAQQRQRKKKGQRKGGGGKQRKPGPPRDKAAARAAGGWRGAAKRQWADLERRHGSERVLGGVAALAVLCWCLLQTLIGGQGSSDDHLFDDDSRFPTGGFGAGPPETPHGAAAAAARQQASDYLALFFEGCPRDGLEFCGAFRPQGEFEGFPHYKNSHEVHLYRHSPRKKWLMSPYFTPEDVLSKVQTGVPTTAVPTGTRRWLWADLDGTMLKMRLRVTGLKSEEEIILFEGHAEEEEGFALEGGAGQAGLEEGYRIRDGKLSARVPAGTKPHPPPLPSSPCATAPARLPSLPLLAQCPCVLACCPPFISLRTTCPCVLVCSVLAHSRVPLLLA